MASFLLIAIIALVALYIIAHFLKGAVKLALKLAVIAAVIAGLLYILPDLQSVQKHFPTSQKLFLLEHDGEIQAGFSSNGTGTAIVESLADYQALYAKNDLKALKGTNYRLIIVNDTALADLKHAELFENVTFTGSQLRALLDSSHARDDLAKLLAERTGIPDLADSIRARLDKYFPTEDALRGYVFEAMVKQAQSNPTWLSLAIARGNARVYPETIAFKLLKQIPASWLKWMSLSAVKNETVSTLKAP